MPLPMPPKNKKEFSWGRFSKTLSFWILILLIPVVLIQLSGSKEGAAKQITYTQYRDELEHNNIQDATIVDGKTVNGSFRQAISVALPYARDRSFAVNNKVAVSS